VEPARFPEVQHDDPPRRGWTREPLEKEAFLKPAWMRRAAWLGTSLAAAAVFAAAAAAAAAQDLETAVQESYPTNLVLLRDATRASVAELFIGFSAPAGETLLVEPEGENPANWYVENQILAHLTEAGFQAYLRQASPRPQPEGAVSGKPGPTDPGQANAASPAEPGPSASLSDVMQTAADTSGAGGAAEDAADDAAGMENAAGAGSPPAANTAADGPHPDYVLRYRVLHFAISYPKNYRTSPLGSRKVQRRVSVSLVASLLQGARENVVWVGDGSSERLDTVPAGKLSLLEGTDFPFTQPVLETRGLGRLVEPALVSGIVLGLVYLFYTNQD
jgi:hypothetical protein